MIFLAALLDTPPESSTTIRLTVNVPALLYVCVVFLPVPVVPSPKFHL